MKKDLFCVIAMFAAMTLVGCGGMPIAQSPTQPTQTTQQPTVGSGLAGLLGQSDNGSQGLVGSLLSSLVGQAMPITAESIYGTWNYTSPECRFESESFLSQAGGAMAASTVENKLAENMAKVGIAPGLCKMTFSKEKTCVITIGERQIQGTYTINPQTREFNFTSQTGLMKLNATAYLSINELTLLFDANKLLTFTQGIGALTGNMSTSASALSSLASSYKGMKLGFNFKK